MIPVRLVGGRQRSGVAALDRDHVDLPDHVVVDGERFDRQGASSIYVFTMQVPK